MESGLPSFPQDFSCPVVLKVSDPGDSSPFAYGTFALYGGPFQGPSARVEFGNSLGTPQSPPSLPYNPPGALKPVGRYFPWGLGFSPFGRRY